MQRYKVKYTVITLLTVTGRDPVVSTSLFFRERNDSEDGEGTSSGVCTSAACLTEEDSVEVLALLRCLLLPIADTKLFVGDVMKVDSASLSGK